MKPSFARRCRAIASNSGMPSAFSEALARIAREELEQYGGMPATQSPLKERIDTYWRFLGYPELHGFAWSAAFI